MVITVPNVDNDGHGLTSGGGAATSSDSIKRRSRTKLIALSDGLRRKADPVFDCTAVKLKSDFGTAEGGK